MTNRSHQPRFRSIVPATLLGCLLSALLATGATSAVPREPLGALSNPGGLRDAYGCEGEICLEQPPNEIGGFIAQDDFCNTFLSEVADDFQGNGDVLIGLGWYGIYQHGDWDPVPPEFFRIDIYLRDPAGFPGEHVYGVEIVDYIETRQEPQGNVTLASYCAYLPDEFLMDEGVEYSISITAGLCQPDQWGWLAGDGNGEEGYTRAPEWGIEEWTPISEIYGVPTDLSFNLLCMFARVDITKSVPGWWPEFGNTTTYTARIYWYDPRSGECIFPGPPKIIQFDLTDISTEKGYSINRGTRDATDLHFNHADNSEFTYIGGTTEECDLRDGDHNHWTSLETIDCVSEATVTVVSEDHGAFGFIEASASGCRGPWPTSILPREPGGQPTCTLGPAKTKIPRDDNGNDIEDTWPGDTSNGNSTASWDAEDNPNPACISTGDGLTRYEEWRGAHVQGAHNRLSTLLKELFVYRENAAWGAHDAASNATIYFITANEMNGARHDNQMGTVNAAKLPRIVNFNRTSHTKVDQHGLWLAVGGGDGNPGNWGLTRNNNGGSGGAFGPPRANGRVEIYSTNIQAGCALRVGHAFRYRPRNRFFNAQFTSDGQARASEMINDTIGHEMGHATNLRHHTQRRVWISRRPTLGGDGWINVNAWPVSDRRQWVSAATNRNCIMAYPFHEIFQSVALVRRWRPERWSSRSAWWGLLPARAVGYGGTCSVPGQPTCTANLKIDDTD
ncbi:MAG: hypothetical protein GF346_01275 [Candidatus Eisenbacteria bacterium]|nr:hypothetical protein [Candidatus Latescibacterota bacterium]MBD3301061.1 hypothetical protein [Candidatus Eisenbacteria bacterium]